jgi:hypothetical protein
VCYYFVVWCGVVWCGVVWCGVEWSGVEWSGVEWSGVEWNGMECVTSVPSLFCGDVKVIATFEVVYRMKIL